MTTTTRREAHGLFLRAAAALEILHQGNPPRSYNQGRPYMGRLESDYTLLDAAEVAHCLADMLACRDRMLDTPAGREAMAAFITLQVSDFDATGRARKLFAAILRSIEK